jgi:hypothetical protein
MSVIACFPVDFFTTCITNSVLSFPLYCMNVVFEGNQESPLASLFQRLY